MTKPIIIFPGSFNPPTTAHRLILTELQRCLPQTPIIILPATRTPHKDPAGLAPFAHRLAMCQLTVRDMVDVSVSDFAAQVSSDQTIDIIEAYRHAAPEAHIIWVLGADSFVSLPVWHRWRDVIGSTALFVLARPELTQDLDAAQPAKEFAATRTTDPSVLLDAVAWYVDPHFNAPVSATAARAGQNNQLLPDVRDYIEQHGLYVNKARV